jgi:arylsulfatase A-like enzyme
MRRRRFALVGLATILVAVAVALFAGVFPRVFPRGAAGPGPEPAEPQRPRIQHVILITIDALRADMLGCYGNPGLMTATLSRLARDAVLFEHAVAPSSWTRPSVASMLNGLPPRAHGTTAREIEVEAILPDDMPVLAELMRGAGYETAAMGYNAFIAFSPNFKRGFDQYAFFPTHVTDSEGRKFPVQGNVGGLKLHGSSVEEMQDAVDTIGTTPILTNLAIQWITDHAQSDFFLWIHYFDPHSPYTPPPSYFFGRMTPLYMSDADYARRVEQINRIAEAYLERARKIDRGTATPEEVEQHARLRQFLEDHRPLLLRLYEAEVEMVDQYLGKVFATLKQLGLYDDALLVVTADHGEEFWEHGHLEHGHSMKQELLHVPLLIKPPKHRGAIRVRERAHVQSVMPTILDLCSIPRPTGPGREPSLASCWERPGSAGPTRPLFAEGMLYGKPRGAVYFGKMKYVREYATGHEELYDLETDPAEQRSLAAENAAALAEGRRLLEQHDLAVRELRKSIWRRGMKTTAPNEAQRKTLRSHGYIK